MTNENTNIINSLLYDRKVIGKDYINDANLVDKTINIIKDKKYNRIITNGKIINFLKESSKFISEPDDYNDHVFKYGTLYDVDVIMPKFMRWDDNRMFFIDENDDIFILNIINL